MTSLATLHFLLMLNAGFAYFLGDPDVFDQMISNYGGEMGTMNSTSLNIYAMGNELVGKVTPPKVFHVLDFLKLMLPSVAATLDIDELNGDDPFNFPVDNFTLNMDINSWCLGTQEVPSLPLIPDFITLSDISVIVCLELKLEANSLADRLQVSSLALAGFWQMGSISLDIRLSLVGSTYYFQGEPTSGLPVGRFIEYLEADLLPEEFATPLGNSGFDSFSIEKARFIGVSGYDGLAIGFSGNPTIQSAGSFRCHLLFTRYIEREYRKMGVVVTIAIIFSDFSLAKLVQKLSGYDISDVPFLGEVTIPETGVIISTGNVRPNLMPELLNGILAQAKPINKGLTFATPLPIVPNQEPVIFVIHIGSGMIKLSIADPGQTLTLGNILKALMPDFSLSELTDLPPGLSDIAQSLLETQLFGFSISTKPMSIAVEIKLNQVVEVVPGFARIVYPSLYMNATFSKPRSIVTKTSGLWEFGSLTFPISIEPAPLPPGQISGQANAKGFLLTGNGNEISVEKIINKFNADFLPAELQSVLQAASMLDFTIVHPTFKIPIGTGAKGFQCHFSGGLIIDDWSEESVDDWSKVIVNAVVSKATGKAALAVGVEFANAGIADLVQHLTGVNVKSLSLLDRSMKVAFVISSRTMDDVALEGEALSEISLERGLSIVAAFTLPTDCQGDSFCEFTKQALGTSASLRISATITSLHQFRFSAGMSDISLGAGMILKEAALEFAFGDDTYAGIRATLTLSDPPLSFTGWVRAGFQGLELGMTMKGIWKRAFGIDFLAFGNGIISITLAPGVLLKSIELGGEIRVGKLDSGREIIANVYAGVDLGVKPTSPGRTYFYGSINDVTIGKVLEAFDIDVSLPACLADSGLPNGLLVSFAFESRTLVSGIVIPQGFVFNGTINILGWRLMRAYIVVNLHSGIKINIRLDPLEIGNGVLKLYKSETETTIGPLLVADVTASPPNVDVTAAGFVSLFFGMIKTEVQLRITNTQYVFKLEHRFFLFDAQLEVYASYGSLQKASFRVKGVLSTEWMKELARRVRNLIDDVVKAVKAKINKAKKKVTAADTEFDNACKSLQAERRNVDSLCRIQSCRKVCMGCPTWRSCCTRWWGSCIGCPGWDSCCWRAPDVICEASNLGCEVLRDVAYAALWLAEKVVDNSRWTLDVAKGVLDGVMETVRYAAEAVKKVSDVGINGIISIKKIEFDVEIGLVDSGHFMGEITVSFFAKPEKTIRFNLRLKSVGEMVSDLADSIFPGITGRRKRDVQEILRRNLPDYSRRHYLPEMYVYKPGSVAEIRPRREYPEPKEVYKKTEFVVRKQSLTDELKEKKKRIEEDLVDLHNNVLKYARSSKPSERPTKAKLLPLTRLKSGTISPADKCEQFAEIKEFIREIPLAMNVVHGEWKNTVGNYTNEVDALTESYANVSAQEAEAAASVAQAKQQFSDFEAAQRNLSDLVEEANNLPNVTSEPPFLTAEDTVIFSNNITEETFNKELVAEVGDGYSEWNRTFKAEIVSENVETIKTIVQAYAEDVFADTGLKLTEYIDQVFTALTAPYETISLDDPNYDSAVRLLESLVAVKKNLIVLIDETVFKAKEISDTLLAELEEIEQIKIFCN